jgi:hypothetical protein
MEMEVRKDRLMTTKRKPIDFNSMKPREVEAYLREQVRRTFGDAVENKSSIFSTRGYYSVSVDRGANSNVEFINFRKGEAGKIAKAIRALK